MSLVHVDRVTVLFQSNESFSAKLQKHVSLDAIVEEMKSEETKYSPEEEPRFLKSSSGMDLVASKSSSLELDKSDFKQQLTKVGIFDIESPKVKSCLEVVRISTKLD